MAWGLLLCLGSLTVSAQTVHRLVVPFPPGGSVDQLARKLAAVLSEKTAQTYIVENRPGADGALAAEHVLRQTGDDNVLLFGLSYLSTGQVSGLFKFDVLQAFKPVIQLGEFETFLVARAGGPLHSGSVLLARLRQGGQKLSCAAPPGQFVLACELLARTFPDQMVVVPFKGEAQALQALLGGRVDVLFMTRTSAHELLTTAKLSLLASADARPPQAPFERTPLLHAAVPDLQLSSYVGLWVSAQTDPAKVLQLNQTLNQVLKSEPFQPFMQSLQIKPVGGTPEVMRQTFLQSVDRFRKWQLPKNP